MAEGKDWLQESELMEQQEGACRVVTPGDQWASVTRESIGTWRIMFWDGKAFVLDKFVSRNDLAGAVAEVNRYVSERYLEGVHV